MYDSIQYCKRRALLGLLPGSQQQFFKFLNYSLFVHDILPWHLLLRLLQSSFSAATFIHIIFPHPALAWILDRRAGLAGNIISRRFTN